MTLSQSLLYFQKELLLTYKSETVVCNSILSTHSLCIFLASLYTDAAFNISTMNLPESFLTYVQQVLPEKEIPLFIEALDSTPTTTIRYNPQKMPTSLVGDQLSWSRYGYKLSERPSFTYDPLFHAGAYYVQDASSQILEHVLKEHVPLGDSLRVLDLCAAPGGKSTHLLSLLSEDSLLVSNEVIAKRSHILRENSIKWGYPNIVVTQKEAWQFQPLEEYFDLIVVDAPCSGEGMFRKDPDAIEEWSPELVELSAQRQRKILADIWRTLRPGGHIVYSTCTYNTKENEENVAWIRDTLRAEVLPIDVDKQWQLHTSLIGSGNALRFFPHDNGGEGFFIAILRKSERATDQSSTKTRKKKYTTVLKEYKEHEVQDWLHSPEKYVFYNKEHEIAAFPKELKEDAQVLSILSPLYMGVVVAEKKGKVLIPHHALSLSPMLNRKHWQSIELSLEDAVSYLRKDVLQVSGANGYGLVSYQNIPLGWLKIIGNRNNNLYPTEWRIRK